MPIEHTGNNLYCGGFWLLANLGRNQHVCINDCVYHNESLFASLTALISALISSKVISGPGRDIASLLQRFHRRSPGVTLDCYVKTRFATSDLQEAIAQYNAQYPNEPSKLHTFERSHDRWLIIDDTVYHFGASLKDLGKRWFSVSVITEHTADELISRL